VALGRAIIREPVAFLMDEPLSNLDALLRVQMRTELLKLHKRVGRTTIYVTHDQIEAMTMADRIVVLRDGVMRQVGIPSEIYSRPADTFIAIFVGSPPMNLIPGHLLTADGGQRFQGPIGVDLAALGPIAGAGEAVTLGVRPENIELSRSGDADAIPGRVELIEAVGADTYLSVGVAEGTAVMVRVSADARVQEGDSLHLRFPPQRLLLFDAAGNRMALPGEQA
jgi:ABC-type sugar transport system ATPase subunit